MPIGITFPISQSTGSLGFLEPTNDIISAIESNVRSLLVTNWGERVMHYDFGCNLIEFLFEPKTKSVRGAIADRIKSQLAKWLPYLQLGGLFIVFPEEDPSVQDPGFGVRLQLTYGNIPIDLFQLFPQT